jgi:hypothetical protein
MALPLSIVAVGKLIGSAVRHPNTAQTMTISDHDVEVEPDGQGGSASTTATA